MAIEVVLAKSVMPQFPVACIFCGQEPDTTVRVRGQKIVWGLVALAIGLLGFIGVARNVWWGSAWFVAVLILMPGWLRRYAVPSCLSCRRRLSRRKLRGVLGLVAVVTMVGVAAYNLDNVIGNRLGRFVWLVPFVFLPTRWFFPRPPIEIVTWPRTVEFDFENAAYATEFATMNGGTIEE